MFLGRKDIILSFQKNFGGQNFYSLNFKMDNIKKNDFVARISGPTYQCSIKYERVLYIMKMSYYLKPNCFKWKNKVKFNSRVHTTLLCPHVP